MKPIAFLRRHRLSVFVLFAVAGILAALWFLGTIRYPAAGEEEIVTVYIPRGTTFSQVVNLVDEKGLIRSRLFFRAMAYYYSAPRRSRPANMNFPEPCRRGKYCRNSSAGR